RTATLISRPILVKTLARAPSVFSFLRLMLFHLLCPDIGVSLLAVCFTKPPPLYGRRVGSDCPINFSTNRAVVQASVCTFSSQRAQGPVVVGLVAQVLIVAATRLPVVSRHSDPEQPRGAG